MGSAHADPAVVRRILLVFPVFQAVYPRAFESFLRIVLAAGRLPGYSFNFYAPERQPLTTAMNSVGEEMCRADHWDACIVFDDDCFAPVDVVQRLLVRCFDEGHAFVAAAGVMRNYPFTTTAARHYAEGMTSVVGPDGRFELRGFTWLDDLPEALTPVDFCGVPVAIIHRRVFRQIARPWFGDQDAKGMRMTHDVYFCNKVREAGIPILVDGTIRCGHLLDPNICTFENRGFLRDSIAAQVESKANA